MPYVVPPVQLVPLMDEQVSFQIEGRERLRWHGQPRAPRPFFFPLFGPSGRPLTRIGHPAAPDHGHHRSVWWGHRDVGGVNFWEEKPGCPQIRQDAWVHYQDGHDEAGMVVQIGWYDLHNARVLKQELIAVLRPLPGDESWLELQTTFTPAVDDLPLGKTNFGFLGLRVAASLSAHYGGGILSNSAGGTGEKDVFGKTAVWVDYSGPIATGKWEGVTWFDHPSNPPHPTPWHVRDDGWMSAAFCLNDGLKLRQAAPLRLRYLLHLHAGEIEADIIVERFKEFAATRQWQTVAAEKPWRVRLRRAEK